MILKMKKTFPIVGMHCAGCALNLTKAIKKVRGVVDAKVTYATDKAVIEYDEKQIDWKALEKAVEGVGKYQIVLGETSEHKDHKDHDHAQMLAKNELEVLRRKVILSLGILVILMVGSLMSWLPIWVSFSLTTVVMFYSGAEFFTNAWMGLKSKTANMDTLVAMGTGTAYLYSSLVSFMPGVNQAGVYFETATAIVGLILLGRYLEAKAKTKAGQAIKELLKLQAKEAILLRNNKEVKVSLDEVVVGDKLVIKPGSKVPVDGLVIEGTSYLDESLITGESKPVRKQKGDRLIGGTINFKGRLVMEVTQVGAETMLFKIAKMVEEAQASQAPIQKLADKVSSVFVPAVIVIALVTFLVWYFVLNASFLTALTFFITVLIISCPCALGLATPIAIMVGTGRGAGMGILIKNAEKLQLAGKIDTLVFDKTGTLTKGNFVVTDVVLVDKSGWDRKKLIGVAAALEAGSEHPIAGAIIEMAKRLRVTVNKVSKFRAIEGKGVEGILGGKKVVIGNQKLMEERGLELTEEMEKKVISLMTEGKTVVQVLVANQHVGVIALADELKEKAKETVKSLQAKEVSVWMMTGDNKKTAVGVAKRLGIKNVVSEVLPRHKASEVERLQAKGGVVAMVGDGVNDAPALAKADVGIAMATGTEVAMETADITLVRGRVELVDKAIVLSKETMKVIVQNLFWAFGYNTILIPVAAGVLVPLGVRVSPILASSAMAFSSLSVVLNSLRLKKIKI